MAAVLSAEEFACHPVWARGADDVALDPDQALGSKLAAGSVRMVELDIALEQDLGLDRPDDFDPRKATVAALYARYAGAPHA